MMYEAAKIKYKGLINKETGKRVYTDDVIDQLVYAGAKVLNYDKRIPQVNNNLALAGITSTIDILAEINDTGDVSPATLAKGVEEIKSKKSINEDELITDLMDFLI